MPRRFAGFMLPVFAALFLLPPGKAVAGPPERVAGTMVFDEVADGLWKYHKETNAEKRLKWLTRLAATRDIRVQITLEDAIRNSDNQVSWRALCLMGTYYLGVADPMAGRSRDEQDALTRQLVREYRHWKEFGREAEVRRRVTQLPR